MQCEFTNELNAGNAGLAHDHDVASEAVVRLAVAVEENATREEHHLRLILFASIVQVRKRRIELNRARGYIREAVKSS